MSNSPSDKKKYNYLENVLQRVNKEFISLPNDEVERNNKILTEILNIVTNKMKEKDPLFKAMYSTPFYGGSYYDGLRVGKPEEFDVDLLLTLPKMAQPTLELSNIPGFLQVQFKELKRFLQQPEASTKYKNFVTLLDDKNEQLLTQKVRAWMEGVLAKTFNEFKKENSEHVIPTNIGNFYIKYSKGGPAITLKVRSDSFKMDIDLVPCFVFDQNYWPKGSFRANPVKNKQRFFIVPKAPTGESQAKIERFWRLSFQEQERVLISRYANLKPSLKLVKKLRDNLEHACIASYYIKTVFLWAVDELDESFWKNPLGYVFMVMLKKYVSYLESGNLPYFWNKKNNLLKAINTATLDNVKNYLRRMLNEIDKNPTDPYVLLNYLVPSDEATRIKDEVDIGKKHLNKMMRNLSIN